MFTLTPSFPYTFLSSHSPPLSPSPLTLLPLPAHIFISLTSLPLLLSSHSHPPPLTGDEVREMLDGLCGVVKAEVDSELINSAHTHAILLRQLFQTADRWHLNLEPKISELENRYVGVCVQGVLSGSTFSLSPASYTVLLPLSLLSPPHSYMHTSHPSPLLPPHVHIHPLPPPPSPSLHTCTHTHPPFPPSHTHTGRFYRR